MTELGNQDVPVSHQETIIATDPLPEIACSTCGAVINLRGQTPFSEVACPDCGQAHVVPAQLGNFRLLRLLGTGGMGGVYEAYDETLGRSVAIKVMLKSLGADTELVETFRREAQAVAKLNHPNIAQIYSFGQEKGQPYIVMELVTGRHLDKLLDERGTLGMSFVIKMALDIAEGLAAADEAGLVHGDIKPENILLDEKGNGKLVDFGLASFVHQAAQEGIWGTPYYIAPEKLRRKRVDARADIYSLGATMYHALAGRPPFEGETAVDVAKARLEHPPPPLNTFRDTINPDVERIVLRMLEAEPARRYPTYASLIGDLRKILPALRKQDGSGGPSRRIVIRKRGVTRKAPAGQAAGAAGEAPPRSSPGHLVVPRGLSATGKHQARRGVTQAGAANETPAKERKKRSPLRAIILLVILLVLAGIFGGRWYLERSAERRQAIARERQLADFRQQIVDKIDALESGMETLYTLQTTALKHFATVSNNVETIENRVIAPPEPLVVPEAPETEATGTDPAAEPDSQDTEPSEAGPDAAEPGEQDGEAEPMEPVEPPPETETETEASLMTMQARRVVEACQSVMAAVLRAERRVARAIDLRERLPGMRSTEPLQRELDTLDEDAALLARLTLEARDAEAAAHEAAARSTRLRETVEAEDRAEAERLARIERERRQREAAEQAARDKAARVEADLAKVRAAEQALDALIKSHDFRSAAAELQSTLRDMDTEEGNAAKANAMARYEALESFKTFLIDQINTTPVRSGWVQDGGRQDILSATRGGAQLRDRAVPWSDIGLRQMLVLIRTLLDDSARTRQIRLRELAQRNLQAAIFCAVNGGMEAARVFADRAIERLPTMKNDVERLIPELGNSPRP